MAIVIRVNGNIGESFLVVSSGGEDFPATVGLRTDDNSTVNAVLQKTGTANLVFSQTNVTINGTETFVNVHATSPSSARNDTVLQVTVGGNPQASVNLTAIQDPEILYRGRFQSRFATNPDYYNNPRPTNPVAWAFWLEGEPDFTPPDSVVDSLTKPVGRVIRFNNPVALRSHTPPVVTNVRAVRATVGGNEEEFTAGDPVIGMPVNLGPNTYFSGQKPKKMGDPVPLDQHNDTEEPMALFELHIGNVVSGKSASLADRPHPADYTPLSDDDLTLFGLPPTHADWQTARQNALQQEYNNLSAADKAGTIGQNIQTRLSRLGSDSGIYKTAELYSGKVNDALTFAANDSPVLNYLAHFQSLTFEARVFTFRADELCGGVDGRVAADVASLIPPLPAGIYNITTKDTNAFHVLNAPAMSEANIDAALGGAPTPDHVVVAVSGTFDRLVVSKVVLVNPADPASGIVSRGASYVFDFRPEASIFARDLIYAVLPPNHERNRLGNCEGNLAVPAPAIGFARLFYDGTEWKLLLHIGTENGAGTTMKGTFSGATATIPNGCTPADLELLTPALDFGSIEQGLTVHRQIVLLNRSAGPIEVTLPPPGAPFGTPGASTVTIPPNEIGTISVSFTAGPPGVSGPTPVTLTSNPIVPSTLTVSLLGTSVALTVVDTVLVLDRSGSMSEPALKAAGRFVSKTDLRNKAAQVFVDLMRDGDRIGMVRFNDAAQPHMNIEAAGVPDNGQGRVDAANALASDDLLPFGATSVGDGLTKANTMLSGPSPATRKAIVVLTDGVENRQPYIASVSLGAGIQAYAIGLGQPQNINVDKLSAITGNTGGYLLVTGDLDAENEFRLQKYYAQILAGISGDSIIVDPRSVILPGDVQRTPFYVTEADSRFDAVLLDRFPQLQFRLEAPDGTRIDPGNVGTFGGQFVVGRACRYYRMRLPVFADDPQRALGKWQMVVEYPGKRVYRGAFALAQQKRTIGTRGKIGRLSQPSGATAYSVLVRAGSSVRLDTRIDQRGFGTDAARRIIAHLTAFGQPYDQNVNLVAQVTRPDGITSIIPLEKKANGRFEAVLDDSKLLGHYNVVVRAAGKTPGGWTLQREQTMSGIVIDPSATPSVDPLDQNISDTLDQQNQLIEELTRKLEQLLAGGGFPVWLKWWLILVLIVLVIIALAILFS